MHIINKKFYNGSPISSGTRGLGVQRRHVIAQTIILSIGCVRPNRVIKQCERNSNNILNIVTYEILEINSINKVPLKFHKVTNKNIFVR